MQLLEISVVAVASLGTIIIAVGQLPAFASLRAKWLGRQHYAHPIPTLLFAALVPVYFVINANTPGRTVFVPELLSCGAARCWRISRCSLSPMLVSWCILRWH